MRIEVYKFLKRFFDIAFSMLLGIIALPIVAVSCILVRIESPGSPLFRQKRLGLSGKEFEIYKIRSMYFDAEKICGAKWAEKDDPRITRIGRFIRRTRIDELPQLINVFKGEMSVVGPRPEREVFYEIFENTIPGFKSRTSVKPGITGLAQVNGGYDLAPEEKFKLDMKYIKTRNIKLDLAIVFITVLIVISGKGAR